MYCANCGVKLADTEKQCPLCGIRAFHPDILRKNAPPLYPPEKYPARPVGRRGLQIVLTALFLLPLVVSLLCDVQLNDAITWSGYVSGALLVAYISCVLPMWFHDPNPVIFIPCAYASAISYLLYISLSTGGGWFMTFGFPVAGFLALLTTAVATLLKYVHKGELYIIGGAILLLAFFMPLMGYLLNLTFFRPGFAFWSLYPAVSLFLLGATLIFLAICRPARQTMERKFFI